MAYASQAFGGAVDAHDDLERAYDLKGDGRTHAGRVAAGVRVSAQVVDELLGAGYVAAGGAEALGEGAHHDVDVAGVAAPEVDDAASGRTDRANAVRLVQIQVGLVLLLDGDDLGQAHNGALHAVDALDHDQYLLPRAARDRMAFDDGLLQLGLQVDRVVVLEHLDRGARQARAEHQRRVIQLVAEYEAALADQSRYVERVGGEAHAEGDGRVDAEEAS